MSRAWRAACFAGAPPGLEEVVRDELAGLGIHGEIAPGGVAFSADLRQLALAHLLGRTPARITVEAVRVRARTLEEVARTVRRGPWKRYVWPGQPVDVRATVRGGRFRNRNALAAKVHHAIADALRGPRLPGPRPPREPARILVHAEGERVRVAVDASGERLHRRGWRRATAKAPLRENLAAAILHLAEWGPGEPLVDPMCGSGTFPIEAATIALGRAPGGARAFDFERWPEADRALIAALRREVREMGVLDADAPIVGADRDPGAIRASRDNARRAEVGRRIRLVREAFADLAPPAPQGLLVANPPYGQRVGSGAFGWLAGVLRARWAGWRVALLVPPNAKRVFVPIGLTEVAAFRNGGIPVRVLVGRIG